MVSDAHNDIMTLTATLPSERLSEFGLMSISIAKKQEPESGKRRQSASQGDAAATRPEQIHPLLEVGGCV